MANKVKYKLLPKTFSNDDKSYRAAVEAYKSLSLEDIIQEMEFRHSSLTTADMVALFEDFSRTIVKRIIEGDRVNLDLFQLSLSIKGTFIDQDDQFDSSRHKVRVCISASRAFQRTVTQSVRVEKQLSELPTPKLEWFFNLEGSEPNTVLSPTHMARIKGERLAFDQNDPRQGLFIMPVNDSGQQSNSEIRVDRFSQATRGQLVFRVPDGLAPGFYRLEVRAIFGTNNLRTGAFKDILEVK
ncbi:MAG: DUF4469 domain-containing protein [Anaerolineales bacterium]|nr:DUF4469 domain-containing protein [Anaerolineales bacterium]